MTQERYSIAAIILHWVIGLAIILMLIGGLTFENWESMPKDLKFTMIQLHKSFGIVLLWAVTLRIFVRLISKTPPLPDTLPKRDKLLAKAGHLALYAAMVIMPVSGWVMVSSSSYGLPTMIFGLFEWPHIPDLTGNKEVRGLSGEIHEIVALGLIGLIVLHVGAVIKHKMVEQVNLLPRMGIGKDTKK